MTVRPNWAWWSIISSCFHNSSRFWEICFNLIVYRFKYIYLIYLHYYSLISNDYKNCNKYPLFDCSDTKLDYIYTSQLTAAGRAGYCTPTEGALLPSKPGSACSSSPLSSSHVKTVPVRLKLEKTNIVTENQNVETENLLKLKKTENIKKIRTLALKNNIKQKVS